jgi:hypothetical protein
MDDDPPNVMVLALAAAGLAAIAVLILVIGYLTAPPDLPRHWIAPGDDPKEAIQRRAPRG